MADDLLSRILGEIRERKEASRPTFEESRRLEQALVALETDGTATVRGHDVRHPRRGGGGRRAAPGANRDAILAVVRDRPGVTAGEIASATGIARATVSSSAARLTGNGALAARALPGRHRRPHQPPQAPLRPAPQPPQGPRRRPHWIAWGILAYNLDTLAIRTT